MNPGGLDLGKKHKDEKGLGRRVAVEDSLPQCRYNPRQLGLQVDIGKRYQNADLEF